MPRHESPFIQKSKGKGIIRVDVRSWWFYLSLELEGIEIQEWSKSRRLCQISRTLLPNFLFSFRSFSFSFRFECHGRRDRRISLDPRHNIVSLAFDGQSELIPRRGNGFFVLWQVIKNNWRIDRQSVFANVFESLDSIWINLFNITFYLILFDYCP